MKKITLFLIMLGCFLTASAQYDFPASTGATNVANLSPVTINLNDASNSAGVPTSSSGTYFSFLLTADWVQGSGVPYSEEAGLIITTSAGSIMMIEPPTTYGLANADTVITFAGNLPGPYDPSTNGSLDIIISQSYPNSDANWSNIVLTLYESPTCFTPSEMSTTTLTTTVADLVWNAGNSETAWNIEYNSGSDFTPGNGEASDVTTATGTPSTSLTGLAEYTTYYVYYQSDCGAADGTSEWVGPFTFYTGYCQSLPSSVDGDGIAQIQLGTEVFTSAGDDTTYEDFTATTVDLASSVSANMQVTYTTGYAYYTYIWIDFNNDLVFDNATELVFSGQATNANPTVFDASFVMPEVPLGVYNMRMTGTWLNQTPPNPCYSGSYGVTADMTVNVTEAPDCIPPFQLVANNVTVDSAELTWNGGSTGLSWDLEWGPIGFVPGTGTEVNGLTTANYTLTGLSAESAYDFYVVSNCDNGTTSTVSGPSTFTTPIQTNFVLDCATAGPLTQDYCYGDNDTNVFTFTSTDGTPLNLTFNAGGIESCCDDLLVFDSNGDPLYADNNGGDLSGLTFQSTGDTISFQIDSDGSISCASGSGCCTESINYTVSCATCISPEATYSVVSDCINGPQFLVEVDLTDLGSATAITLSDNQGSSDQNVSAAGIYIFGPYPNLTDVIITVANDDDTNCTLMSSALTQEICTESFIDCATDGPLTLDYCYENNDTNVFTYTSTDGTPLNLTFNAGGLEVCCDDLIVFDSNGDVLYADNNGGDLSGLTFQSTGDTISFQIDSDGSVSCSSGSSCCTETINYTVSCATCINPQATYAVVDDCNNGEQFLVDVDILTVGDATSLTISNNINGETTTLTEAGLYQIGPFEFGVDVIVTVSNDNDVNCVINSDTIVVYACPPANDNPCGATIAVVNDDILCEIRTPGTILAATPSGVPNDSCGGDADDDVWFQFEAQSEYQLIALANIAGSTTDIGHSVYEGTCDNLTEISCAESGFFSAQLSSATPQLVVGNTYFIRVFSYGSSNEDTTFDLCITPYVAPVNLECDLADNYCSGSDASDILYTYNTIDVLPGSGSIDCLFTTPNPTYSVLEVGNSGDLLIEMVQNTAFDENDNPIGDELDVDFVLWGPFASGDSLCDLSSVVDCSYSADAVENVTLTNAVEGEIYLLLITNYAEGAGVIQVRQTNIGEPGSGSTIADISASIVSNDVYVDPTNDPLETDEVSVCGFDSVTIETYSPFADDFVWTKNGTEIIGENLTELVVTESGSYQVQAFDSQCNANALSQVVIINLYKDPEPVAPQNITVCDGLDEDGSESFDLEALSASLALPGFTITYYTTTANANQAIEAVTSPYISSGETLIMRIEDTDAYNNGFVGCRELSQVELVVNPRPVINQPEDFTVCDDLDGIVDGITEFDLISLNDEVTTDPNMVISYHATLDAAEAGTGALTSPYSSQAATIYVRAEDSTTGCYQTTSFNLEINLVPLADFDMQYDYIVCPPPSTAEKTIGLIPTNFSAEDVTVSWTLDGNDFSGSGLTLTNVVEAGVYSALITFNDSGCSNPVSITVEEAETCIFPEGISPGVSIGKNDTFDLSSFNVTKLEIFNRNGTLVYSKNNYRDEWVGQTNDGDELPVGTYFYTVVYEGGAKTKSAWVYINR